MWNYGFFVGKFQYTIFFFCRSMWGFTCPESQGMSEKIFVKLWFNSRYPKASTVWNLTVFSCDSRAWTNETISCLSVLWKKPLDNHVIFLFEVNFQFLQLFHFVFYGIYQYSYLWNINYLPKQVFYMFCHFDLKFRIYNINL